MAASGYEQIINNIEQMIADARPSRFNGLVKIDAEKLRAQLDLLRSSIPDEVMQARRIATDRKRIIATAKENADKSIEDANARAAQIIADAEQRASGMLDETSIVREAQARANQLDAAAAADTAAIRSQAQAYKAEVEAKATQYYNETVNKALLESTQIRLEASNYCKQVISGFKTQINESINYFSGVTSSLDFSEQRLDSHISRFDDELRNLQYAQSAAEATDGTQE